MVPAFVFKEKAYPLPSGQYLHIRHLYLSPVSNRGADGEKSIFENEENERRLPYWSR